MRYPLKKAAAFIMSFLLMSAVMTTGVLAGSGIALDVNENRVYASITAFTLLDSFSASPAACKSAYDGSFLVIYGTVSSRSSDLKSFTIRDNNNSGLGSIRCSASKAVNGLGSVNIGDTVRVFGELDVTNNFISSGISLKADKVEATGMTTVSDRLYMTANGTALNRISMSARNIEGKFRYRIPASWVKVERPLPNVSGYQYMLNELSGDGIAESVFVFWVDGSVLKEKTDISKTDRVRRAIVEDILCNKNLKMYSSYVPLFDRDITITKKKADYASFTYYTGNYRERNINRYSHRVEFAFINDDREDGVRAILYVYNDPALGSDVTLHTDEVLLMMRMLGEE